MKKQVFGRNFKRDANERKALFKNLLTSLVLKERIKTTEAKAKAIKGQADKLVTKAKKAKSTDKAGSERAYKALHPDVNQEAVVKLITDIAPRFAKRQGGYTRIIKVGKRRVADNAEMAIIEWTEVAAVKPKAASVKKSDKKTGKKEAVADTAPAKGIINKEVKQPRFKEVAKKLITRQKKGQ